MIRRPPRSTRADTHFPYTTLFRSELVRGNEGPCCSGSDGVFEVLGEAPVSIEPSQRSLDDPAPGQHDEAFCRIRSLDDLEGPFADAAQGIPELFRSEEHTSELQSLMRISYAVFCLKQKKTQSQSPYLEVDEHTSIHTYIY